MLILNKINIRPINNLEYIIILVQCHNYFKKELNFSNLINLKKREREKI